GAGNLLGEEQSGEIAAVGLELYNHLLGQAVNSLRGKPVAESPSQVTVTLPMAAHLPAAYVPDEGLRLRAYRELAACASEPELEKRVRELVDRFGPLPQPARGLVLSLRVRLLAAACDALAVETEPNRRSITIQLPQAHGLDLPSVVRQYRSWLSSSATRLHLSPPASAGRLDVQRAGGASVVWEGSEWVDVLLKVLRELGRLARSARRPQAEAV
ncbi:MAG TPA: TRCF domain-containing protein, partial [Candidatus Sulfotelmatobacter sp.]|nr:TRCF domain-containing protein [Candidatus Sulfotelmatobacter sp.]